MHAHTSVKVTMSLERWEAIAKLHAQVAPRLDNMLSARHGLALVEFQALRALARHFQPHMRIQRLADEIGLSPSATSRLVARLETSGHLRRYLCETDKRGIYTELTESGREAMEAAEISYRRDVEEMMSSEAAQKLIGD